MVILQTLKNISLMQYIEGFPFNPVAVIFNIEPSKSVLYIKLGQCQKALQKTNDSMSSISKAINCAKNKRGITRS